MVEKKSVGEIKKFLNRLGKDYKVDKILFFGSRAYGNYHRDSDFDLIIVSDDFKELDYLERVSKMYDYWKLDIAVDFLCYTNKEFNKLSKMISIVSHALKNGLIILP